VCAMRSLLLSLGPVCLVGGCNIVGQSINQSVLLHAGRHHCASAPTLVCETAGLWGECMTWAGGKGC
jgi:hypothetical protein